jgi:hypothetical protein
MRSPLALLLVALAPWPARALAPGDPITAVRRLGAIVVDGRLDEDEWDRGEREVR